MAAVPTTSLGNSNVAGQVEVMELTSASQREREKHQLAMLDMEAKNRAFSIDVPTLPNDVRQALRNMGLPVRLFGENLANVRDRLRMAMARKELMEERGIKQEGLRPGYGQQGKTTVEGHDEEEQITKYSRASPDLIQAREKISKYSLERARDRLDKERNYRVQWERKRARLTVLNHPNDDKSKEDSENEYIEVTRTDEECMKMFKTIKKMGAEGSQYGDPRPLSCMTTLNSGAGVNPLVATGSWSGTIKLWDTSLNCVAEKTLAHEDRIMGIALRPNRVQHNVAAPMMMATSSIDLTAKLWRIRYTDDKDNQEDQNEGGDAMMDESGGDTGSTHQIQEVAHLKGHASRLCKVAFHPLGDHVVTTSFDHTWRMWDVETGGEILLQDGHSKEVYGVGFHPDGSLCSTTDYGGVVHLWDLRTGKSAHHFLGHAKRVLCSEFSPNGFQLATAGDDGTLKIWDLRKRRQFASVPAHSKLVTQLRFQERSSGGVNGGEFLVSSSFDGTAKVWSARDWKLLTTLRGHEGKVMGTGLLSDCGVVTCGFDKTLKLWK
eukprot:CAMPEP_0172368398 /NCGR_PEP_ID=MMETSP1060-20121228/26953_1 /TAXON_ID=37318 /ORGANISM="Pseudo-nitzschia pungens, Strain cf. cingulata" /LENGTH=548 /DNA_ID=CAMNT_0013092975 /DNA_START=85 /DNA_END=1731 /DNA_ORIENTATION=+